MPTRNFAEFARRCHKPDHDRIGNWMARRISRPAALRITWVVASWGVTANMATLAAWACGLAAAACFSGGSAGWWLAGAGLLQLWYLLDHVDGQLARLWGVASLDGAQLDYVMHHTINLLIPLGVGQGLAHATGQSAWSMAGLAWGLGLLLIGLQDDARYKAFILRLKRLEGELLVRGGGGFKAVPQPPVPRQLWGLARWAVHKCCEIHVVMNVLTVLALVALATGGGWIVARAVLVVLVGAAVLLAGWTIVRSQAQQAVEQEFARWFHLPADRDLIYRNGWWMVIPRETTETAQDGEDTPARQNSS